MIVTVYIDESGTHDSPVTIMAGWVARLGQWAQFDPKWNRLLKDNELSYFHSRKFRHGKDEFKGWKIDQKNTFLDRAKILSAKHLAFGFVISLTHEAYEQHYVSGHRPREVQLDSPYGLCFRYCLSHIPRLAKEAFGNRPLDINFVLEAGHKNAGDAVRIFHKCKNTRTVNQEELEIMAMLAGISFGEKEDYPGLQAADINAYSGFQHEINPMMTVVNLPNVGTMKAAKKRQPNPVFRLRVTEHSLTWFRKFIQDEIDEKHERRRKANQDRRV